MIRQELIILLKAIANGTYINDHFAKVDWNKIYQNI